MDLILVRHGLPVRREVASGAADPGLSALGARQAGAVASWLADERVDAVVHSPARRAIETARPIAAGHGLATRAVDGLAEYDRGATSYVPLEELKAAGDWRWRATQRGELWGDVDPAAFRRDVVAAVEGLIAEHRAGCVVAVCHGGVINAYVGHVLGIERSLWFAPDYAGITRVAGARTGERSVRSLNETGHLRRLVAD